MAGKRQRLRYFGTSSSISINALPKLIGTYLVVLKFEMVFLKAPSLNFFNDGHNLMIFPFSPIKHKNLELS